jgi:hypothetical protein
MNLNGSGTIFCDGPMVPAGNGETGVQLLSAQPGPVMPPASVGGDPPSGAPLLPPELVPLEPLELLTPELLTPELLAPELLPPELLPLEPLPPELLPLELLPLKPPLVEVLPHASTKTATTPAAPNRKMSRRDSKSTETLVVSAALVISESLSSDTCQRSSFQPR